MGFCAVFSGSLFVILMTPRVPLPGNRPLNAACTRNLDINDGFLCVSIIIIIFLILTRQCFRHSKNTI